MESLRKPGHRRWVACGFALGLFGLLASSPVPAGRIPVPEGQIPAPAGHLIEQTIAVPVQVPVPGGPHSTVLVIFRHFGFWVQL